MLYLLERLLGLALPQGFPRHQPLCEPAIQPHNCARQPMPAAPSMHRRVEESVLLAERLRKEKEEVQARCDMLAADRDALEAQLDPSARDEQVGRLN